MIDRLLFKLRTGPIQPLHTALTGGCLRQGLSMLPTPFVCMFVHSGDYRHTNETILLLSDFISLEGPHFCLDCFEVACGLFRTFTYSKKLLRAEADRQRLAQT